MFSQLFLMSQAFWLQSTADHYVYYRPTDMVNCSAPVLTFPPERISDSAANCSNDGEITWKPSEVALPENSSAPSAAALEWIGLLQHYRALPNQCIKFYLLYRFATTTFLLDILCDTEQMMRLRLFVRQSSLPMKTHFNRPEEQCIPFAGYRIWTNTLKLRINQTIDPGFLPTLDKYYLEWYPGRNLPLYKDGRMERSECNCTGFLQYAIKLKNCLGDARESVKKKHSEEAKRESSGFLVVMMGLGLLICLLFLKVWIY